MKNTAFYFLCIALLSGCVSQSTVVNHDRTGTPKTDNKEAARTRMALGLNYLQRGDTSQAKFNLERAKQLAPEMSEIDNALAYYFQQVGELEQAEAAYRAALKKDRNNADTYNNFGSFLCQIQKYKEAETLLMSAIKRPGYIRVADSYENLALCALAQKDYLRYQQFLRQSLQHNSNKTSTLYAMALADYASGNLSEAKRWQNRLHQLGELSAAATFIRYLIAYHSGDIAEQQSAEKFLLKVHPASPEAAMVLSSDFSQSEAEQLRQLFKSNLLEGSVAAKTEANQPKMKIVRKKTAAAGVVATALSAQDSLQENTKPALVHIVAAGDTIYNIASRYRVSISELQRLNQLDDQSPITPGQRLYLADKVSLAAEASLNKAIPEVYTVKEGDSWFSIAYKFNLELPDLLNWNQMSAEQHLTTGQVIYLKDPVTPSS